MIGKFVIIGLCGAPGSGKSTVAEYLHQQYGLVRLRFADPLKNMLRAYYQTIGLHPTQIERRIEGDLKTAEDSLLCGRAPRYAMQTLGTEWGRDIVNPGLWTSAWARRVGIAQAAGASGVVCEDLRFPNEEVALRVAGGKLVRIARPGYGVDTMGGGAPGHSSEGQPLSPDITVANVGEQLDEVGKAVADALRGHTKGEWL